MAPPPPSSLPARLPASNSGGGEERERGRRGTRRGTGAARVAPNGTTRTLTLTNELLYVTS